MRVMHRKCMRCACTLQDGGHNDDATIVWLQLLCHHCHHITVAHARACGPRVE